MKTLHTRSKTRRARNSSLSGESQKKAKSKLKSRNPVATSLATLNTLQRLSREITLSLNLDEVYRAIYRGAGELMDCDAFFISTFDPHSKIIKFVFSVDQGKL